jgi:hypothetical protein
MNDREKDLGLSRRGAAQLAHWSEPLVLATNLTVEIPYERLRDNFRFLLSTSNVFFEHRSHARSHDA